MTTIGANGSAIASYAKSIGSAIASAGKPVIVTFAHEFNVSGQYPWAQGDCEGTTGSQWVSAWDAVRNDIDSTANGLAYFMWVPDVFNGAGGTVIDPTAYWPGASNVDMVGVDGYPQSQYGETSFANTFAQTFSIIKGLTGESTIAQPKIFVAETNFSPLGSGRHYQCGVGCHRHHRNAQRDREPRGRRYHLPVPVRHQHQLRIGDAGFAGQRGLWQQRDR
jgi:beta-mannanase